MLRVELAPNGAFNVTEFGTVKDPEQFKALYAYSPYHHVTDGTKYPGDPDDDRRERRPGCALSFAQDDGAPPGSQQIGASDSAAHPTSAGHGIGTALSERIKQQADIFGSFSRNWNAARHRRMSAQLRSVAGVIACLYDQSSLWTKAPLGIRKAWRGTSFTIKHVGCESEILAAPRGGMFSPDQLRSRW